jgi:hypothetical protein
MYKPNNPDLELNRADADAFDDSERWLEDAELAAEIQADWEQEEEAA